MQLAFTLAEVLIVLGIIGLIADMTIPTLIQSTQEKVAATRLKKTYSTIESAFRLAVADNGTPDNWSLETDGPIAFLNHLKPRLNIIKDCGNGGGCFSEKKYKILNGTPVYDFSSVDMGQSRAQLADGTLLVFSLYSSDCSAIYGDTPLLSNVCGGFAVDIDGNKGKNQYGYDTFSFYITKNGIVPFGTASEKNEGFLFGTCKRNNTGYGCPAWVIYNENMDYLHCDDLSWDGKKKCK